MTLKPMLFFSIQGSANHLKQDTEICFLLFNLDPMTLIYDLNIDTTKMYLRVKNELSRSMLSKVRAV